MYDPFATPPAPGMVQTTSAPLPMPPVPAANNALAALYNKHMRGMQGGMAYPGGGMGVPGTPGGPPNTMFPLNPHDHMGGQGFDQDAFRQAKMDWRADRPDRQSFDPQGDWRIGIQDWRSQRPMRSDYYTPGA